MRRLRGWRWQNYDVAIETSWTLTWLFVFVGLIHLSFTGSAEGSLGEKEARHWCKIFHIFLNNLRNTWGSFQALIPSQTKSHWMCFLILCAFNKSVKVYIRMFDLIWVELQRLFFLWRRIELLLERKRSALPARQCRRQEILHLRSAVCIIQCSKYANLV